MREPKYQAWLGSEMVQVVTLNTIKNSKGLYDEYSKGYFLNGENKGRHTSFDLNIATLRQFTGLHDKNGTPIYEGDLVKGKAYEFHNCPRIIGEVVYSYCEFKIKATRDGKSKLKAELNATYEVVGNVFEHSHLLEQTT